MIAVLYCTSNSIYKRIAVCDAYDEKRDARTFVGSCPVIAHPPCRLFSKLRKFSTAPVDEKKLAHHALVAVRMNGGVLEHPAFSKLWQEAELPIPGQGADKYGGWSMSIDQSWFGHECPKNTWLYIVGVDRNNIPDIHLPCAGPTKTMGMGSRRELSKTARNKTPARFAHWLVQLALRVI